MYTKVPVLLLSYLKKRSNNHISVKLIWTTIFIVEAKPNSKDGYQPPSFGTEGEKGKRRKVLGAKGGQRHKVSC